MSIETTSESNLPTIMKLREGVLILDDQNGTTTEIPLLIDNNINRVAQDLIDLVDFFRKPTMGADTVEKSLEKGTWVVT